MWLPSLDTFRTLGSARPSEMRLLSHQRQQLGNALLCSCELLVAETASEAHRSETGGHEHEGNRFGDLTLALIGAIGL